MSSGRKRVQPSEATKEKIRKGVQAYHACASKCGCGKKKEAKAKVKTTTNQKEKTKKSVFEDDDDKILKLAKIYIKSTGRTKIIDLANRKKISVELLKKVMKKVKELKKAEELKKEKELKKAKELEEDLRWGWEF